MMDAAAEGKLQFALRNVTDNETVLTTGATISQTLKAYRAGQQRERKTRSKKVPKVYKRVYKVEELKGGRIIKRE